MSPAPNVAPATPLRTRTRDGATIACSVHEGAPGAPRLLLVHSLAMDGAFWTPLAEEMGNDVSILAVDCRGHGASDKPAGPYTVELFADDLRAAMDAAGWETAIVAGASMGGCVALAFADRHPGRTAGLGLIDTTAWYGPEAPKAWDERARKAEEAGLASMVDFQVSRWFSDGFREARPDRVQAAVDTFLNNDVAGYAATCRMLGACDLRAALPRVAVPTRIVVGEEDYATPVAMAEAMQAGIPGAKLTVLDGVRHFTPLECPDRIAGELRVLLDAAGRNRPRA